MERRIVIDLYDHTSETEIAEILDALRGIGIDDARFESASGVELGGYVRDPDTGARVWTTDTALLAALGRKPGPREGRRSA